MSTRTDNYSESTCPKSWNDRCLSKFVIRSMYLVEAAFPMSDHSAIEWTDATWNPVRGCTQISPGCDHCYAQRFAERFRGVPGHPYEQGFDLKLWPERLELPLRWRKPKRIFVDSMADLFHEDVPDDFIHQTFDVMRRADWHLFHVLTRHARRMARM